MQAIPAWQAPQTPVLQPLEINSLELGNTLLVNQ